MGKVRSLALLVALATASGGLAQDLSVDDVRSTVHTFDDALSAKRFDDAWALLAEDLTVSLADCDGNINRMGFEVFVGLFGESFEAVTRYSRVRADERIEIDEDGRSGALLSSLTESIEGQGFEVSGESTDRTVVERRGSGVLIVSIESTSQCR